MTVVTVSWGRSVRDRHGNGVSGRLGDGVKGAANVDFCSSLFHSVITRGAVCVDSIAGSRQDTKQRVVCLQIHKKIYGIDSDGVEPHFQCNIYFSYKQFNWKTEIETRKKHFIFYL